MNRYLVTILLSLMLAPLCFGTPQIPDNIYFQGKLFSIDRRLFPLEEYWSNEHPMPRRISGFPTSTALFRGYVATWELTNKLYLKSLRTDAYPRGEQIPLNEAFPDTNGITVANWFSGVFEFSCEDEHWYVSLDEGNRIGAKRLDSEQFADVRSKDMDWTELADPNNTATFNQGLEAEPNLIGSAQFASEMQHVSLYRRKGKRINAELPPHITEFWRKVKADLREERGDEYFESIRMRLERLSKKKLISDNEFSFRGLYFPAGKVWLAPYGHLKVELPASIEAPKHVMPVQIKGTYKRPENEDHGTILATEIKVLPNGAVIQRAKKPNQSLEGTR